MRCNKMSFKKKSEADTHIKIGIARKRANSERELMPRSSYNCHKCGYWHLTSNVKPHKKDKMLFKKLKKINELEAIKSLDKKWEWLFINQAKWMVLHDNERTYLTFTGTNARVMMD